jgi:HTH-type transcriptional regulator / antitoxin HigA
MEVNPVRTQEEYEAAMNRMEELWGTPVGDSPESVELDILLALTGAYEKKHHHVPSPSPQDMYEYHLDRVGVSPEEIERITRSRKKLRSIITETTGLSTDTVDRLGEVPLKVFTAE